MAKLEGANMSRTWRVENSTIASFCGATPRTPVVAACHHCSVSRKPCANRLNGGSSQPDFSNRRSCGCALIRVHGFPPDEKKCRAISKNCRVPLIALWTPAPSLIYNEWDKHGT